MFGGGHGPTCLGSLSVHVASIRLCKRLHQEDDRLNTAVPHPIPPTRVPLTALKEAFKVSISMNYHIL